MFRSAKKSIHWRVPTLMVSSLIVGGCLVLGHHLFYDSLAGRAVADARYDQQWNIRIGTGFSYLVRCALVIAVGVAYWQMFWGILLQHQLTVSTIDSLAGLPNDLTELFHFKAIRASPILMCLGIVSWLIPLAAVVPPATLTVLSVEVLNHELTRLQTPDWDAAPIARKPLYEEVDAIPYNGPAKETARLLAATAMQGELPNIPFPSINSSFVVQMPGPAVQCKNIDAGPILQAFDKVMGTNVSCAYTNVTCLNHYSYLAWVPDEDFLVPFADGSMNWTSAGSLPVNYPSYITGTSSYLGSYHPNWTDATATLFVATRNQQQQQWELMNCTLWNATHTVAMQSTNGRQNLSVLSTDFQYPVDLRFIRDPDQPNSLFTYQAMMEFLGKEIVGSIHWTVSSDKDFIITTQATQTELAFTAELFPTYNGSLVTVNTNAGLPGPASYSSVFATNQTTLSPYAHRHLNTTVEQLFQNMTLALLSRPEYTKTSLTPTNVTITTYHNVYAYSSSQLWLSYGLALATSFAAVVVGLFAVWQNQASYCNRFSTILRTTCDDEICSLINQEAKSGAEPVPHGLREAKICLGPHRKVRA